ncbi:MAG: glycoside hydrolase family 5 protein [Sandaracinaceae bacterium]|nr:glycoside hydrolase family 5 protein [Sandaracinaceae bacterium]
MRYGDDPTVFAWELVNEPRCDDARFCDAATLVEWARAMAGALRGAGARQPIAWGGVGFAGEHGEDLEALAADGAVEILTLHLYPGLAGAVSLGPPAEGDHAIAAAVRAAPTPSATARRSRGATAARSSSRRRAGGRSATAPPIRSARSCSARGRAWRPARASASGPG